MQPEPSKEQVVDQNKLLAQLLDMGFQEVIVRQALQVTTTKEHALNYIIKTLEDIEKLDKPKFPPNIQIVNTGPLPKSNKNNESDFEDVDEEDFKMVFVVRMDLKMGLGKMAAQVGHATLGAYKRLSQLSDKDAVAEHALFEWTETGQKKIVVKVNTEQELFKIADEAEKKKINFYVVRDAGRTQIKAGSVTVLGLGPAPSADLDKITGHLKLL